MAGFYFYCFGELVKIFIFRIREEFSHLQVLLTALILVILSIPSPTPFAHDDPHAPVPSFRALKVDAPLQVDGVLDEPFWQQAEVTSNFIDDRSHQSAAQQSTIRVAYTRTHLYVAVECLDDNMAQVHATERREDRSFQGDDWMEVQFEPSHSHTSKYAFFSNPLGTRSDANEGPSGVFNRGWSADWDLAAKIYEDRWTFEMRIPFSIMNYKVQDNQVWGVNFTRSQRSNDSTSFWSFNPTEPFKPKHFGHLTGLDLADAVFDRNLEITPYVSSRMDFDGDTDSFFQTGLDTSFRLTPSITTSWAINPDFGQVESDDDTIELRDTERFLEEKRLFFREGEELMRQQHRLYYSRRFSDIETGAKVSGRWRDFDFSFLNIQGDVSHGETRYGNNSVFRSIQKIGEKSSIGYYLSDSEFEDGHSRVFSSDGILYLNDEWKYYYQLSLADDRDENDLGVLTKDALDFLGHSSIEYSKYPFEFDFGYNAITKEFDPFLGYIPRRDIFGPYATAEYHADAEESWYKRLDLFLDTRLYEDHEHRTTIRDMGMEGSLVFPNDFGLLAGYENEYHYPYNNQRTSAGFSLFSSDFWRSMNFRYSIGEFEETDYDEYTFGKRWQPFERLPIRYEFSIRFEDEPNGDQDTIWLNRIVFDYYFTDRMWLKSSIQHLSDSRSNISLIYGWEFRRKAFWYVVFNRVQEEQDEEAVNSIFTKVAYTF